MTTYPALPHTLLNPAREYARWCAEEEPEQPLRRVTLPDDSTPWLVTRHADARAVLADPRFSADASRPGFPGARKYTRQPRPGHLDITRNADRHLAFGHSPHQCIGQSLARIELETALPTLFRRLPACG